MLDIVDRVCRRGRIKRGARVSLAVKRAELAAGFSDDEKPSLLAHAAKAGFRANSFCPVPSGRLISCEREFQVA